MDQYAGGDTQPLPRVVQRVVRQRRPATAYRHVHWRRPPPPSFRPVIVPASIAFAALMAYVGFFLVAVTLIHHHFSH